jgi:hypothetical protein
MDDRENSLLMATINEYPGGKPIARIITVSSVIGQIPTESN